MRHEVIDKRSLAYGQAIAARVKERPELVNHARANIERWMKDSDDGSRRSLEEWLAVLDGPLDGVLALLTGEDQRSVRLRQSNPFTRVLTNEERNRIIRQFSSHDPATT